MVPIKYFFKNPVDYYFLKKIRVFAECTFFSVTLERNNNGLILHLLEQEEIIKCQWPGFTELNPPIPQNRYIHLY